MAATVDVDQVKATLAKLHEPTVVQAHTPVTASADAATGAVAAARAELRAFAESEPELGRLGSLLGRYRAERAAALRAAQAAARRAQADGGAAAAARAAWGAEAAQVAAGLLANPYTSSWVTIETPFLIDQVPQIDPYEFKGSQIEPGNSWFKLLIDTDSGPGNVLVNAYYLWENPSDYYTAINVYSGVSVNGTAQAWGASGDFSGNWANLQIAANLVPLCWSGWGVDPATGEDRDGSAYPVTASKSVLSVYAYGGDWFSDSSPQSKTLTPFDWHSLTIRGMAIPGRAVTLFPVGFQVDWQFTDDAGTGGEDDQIGEGVLVDLADEQNAHMVRPGMLSLEVLTPSS